MKLKIARNFFLILFALSIIGTIIELSFLIQENKIALLNWGLNLGALIFLSILVPLFYLIKYIRDHKLKRHFLKDPRFREDFCKAIDHKWNKINLSLVYFIVLITCVYLGYKWFLNPYYKITSLSLLFAIIFIFPSFYLMFSSECKK
ncbi:hypothetical protein [Mycoplasma procyoni]|uniref:hypothetical protein n=1 Tax=Mycoplasma procyoni TaxID=568784 RepID=UPI00197B31E1|nr:hypothetical protein [Mycoplasma procyoni]MBN3534453.1 hypothetical protein [Mycoplasma procyoni]